MALPSPTSEGGWEDRGSLRQHDWAGPRRFFLGSLSHSTHDDVSACNMIPYISPQFDYKCACFLPARAACFSDASAESDLIRMRSSLNNKANIPFLSTTVCTHSVGVLFTYITVRTLQYVQCTQPITYLGAGRVVGGCWGDSASASKCRPHGPIGASSWTECRTRPPGD